MGLAREGLRMLARNIRVRTRGWKHYSGSTLHICQHIIDDCWNGTYLQTSAGHFNGFYIRDFAWCVPSLITLGHRARVHATLAYALSRYTAQRLTTTITASGTCLDVFTYAPDSLAYLLHSLHHLGDASLWRTHREFLQRELNRFARVCLHNATLRSDRHFSGIKDHSTRRSATYDLWMLALIEHHAPLLGLSVPWTPRTSSTSVRWNGTYYRESDTSPDFSAEANIIPFWLGLDTNTARLNQIVNYINKHALDHPVGLAYSATPLRTRTPIHYLAPNYEGTTRWMHLGLLYLDVLVRYKHPRAHTVANLAQAMVQRDRNVLELYTARGVPYRNLLYHADEGMIWAALLPPLVKHSS